MNQLKGLILKTIEYGRKFGTEYRDEEITERLISDKKYSDQEVILKLREIKRPEIGQINNKILSDKVDKAKRLGELLAERFPDILMVGITGSVAAGYPKKNEDIDLMIITKKDSLWITRLGVKIWTRINNIPRRKYGIRQKKDDFCFNLWLEEESLKLPVNRQGLRNAMDLILMKPIVNKNKIYEKFIGGNEWVKKYVANGYGKLIFNFKFLPKRILQSSIISNEKQKNNILKKIINRTVFELQYFYMKRKFTGETVDLKRAFFHPQNRT